MNIQEAIMSYTATDDAGRFVGALASATIAAVLATGDDRGTDLDDREPAEVTPVSAQLTPNAAMRFALAGRATFTVVSKRTGTRYTYRVTARKRGGFGVGVLAGSENDNDASYLDVGYITPAGRFNPASDAPSARAFAFCFARDFAHPELEIHHAGRCGRCGRLLTDPESISRGLGATCAEQSGW
jgi:hypothetical protein